MHIGDDDLNLADHVRPVVLVGIFGALGLALGASVCPNSDWTPGLVLIGACVGGLVEAVWVLARTGDDD
jgi:hypothetical protein